MRSCPPRSAVCKPRDPVKTGTQRNQCPLSYLLPVTGQTMHPPTHRRLRQEDLKVQENPPASSTTATKEKQGASAHLLSPSYGESVNDWLIQSLTQKVQGLHLTERAKAQRGNDLYSRLDHWKCPGGIQLHIHWPLAVPSAKSCSPRYKPAATAHCQFWKHFSVIPE